MALTEITTTLMGKEVVLKVELDPTWGEFEQVIQNATQGGQGSSYTFFEEITKAVVKEGLPFDAKNRTAWKLLPMSEFTALIGKVMKVFPLGNYLDNLGMDNPIFKNFLQ